jgi:hypothetical protein
MAKNSRRPRPEIVGLLGVALDAKDGQKRITRNEEIVLVGGSEETHAVMQDVSIKVNESLRERGKRLRDAEADEVADLLREALDS